MKDQTPENTPGRIVRTFTDTSDSFRMEHEAYSDDNGVTWRWPTNDAYCPLDSCTRLNIPCDMARQEEERSKQVAEKIAAYRANASAEDYDEERLCEMRNAFGAGATVVNVITGRKTRL